MADIFVGASSAGLADGTSIANRYGDLQDALDDISAGAVGDYKYVNLISDGVHTTAVRYLVNAIDQKSTNDQPIIFRGMNTNGDVNLTGDDRPTLQATASMTNILQVNGVSTGSNVFLYDLILDGNNNTTGEILSLGDSSCVTFAYNVDFINSGADAVENTVGGSHTFINCRFVDNDNYGYDTGLSDGSASRFYNCVFKGNGLGGVHTGGLFLTFEHCLFYSNTGYGFETDNSEAHTFIGCLFYDNSDGGMHYAAAANDLDKFPTIINSVFYKNGGAGDYHIDMHTTSSYDSHLHFIRNNWFGDDGSMAGIVNNDLTPSIISHPSNIQAMASGNPGWTSTTIGSENFTPTSVSALLNNLLQPPVR